MQKSHIAIKCTYNDGDEGFLVGFNGTCTDETIKRNIESGRVWCNFSLCRDYYEDNFDTEVPKNPCYESILFKNLSYRAGIYHSGERANTPIHIRKTDSGKIVILTTRFPKSKESERKIIGFFKIEEVVDRKHEETELKADKLCYLRLPRDVAYRMDFWDYYSIKNGEKFWSTGLFRYLNDEQVLKILNDLKKQNIENKMVIEKAIKSIKS